MYLSVSYTGIYSFIPLLFLLSLSQYIFHYEYILFKNISKSLSYSVLQQIAYFKDGIQAYAACQEGIVSRLLSFRIKGPCIVDMEATTLQIQCNKKELFAYISLWWKCNIHTITYLITIYHSQTMVTNKTSLFIFPLLFVHYRVDEYMQLYTMIMLRHLPPSCSYTKHTIFGDTTYAEASSLQLERTSTVT